MWVGTWFYFLQIIEFLSDSDSITYDEELETLNGLPTSNKKWFIYRISFVKEEKKTWGVYSKEIKCCGWKGILNLKKIIFFIFLVRCWYHFTYTYDWKTYNLILFLFFVLTISYLVVILFLFNMKKIFHLKLYTIALIWGLNSLSSQKFSYFTRRIWVQLRSNLWATKLWSRIQHWFIICLLRVKSFF